jgi:hypothetical protein
MNTLAYLASSSAMKEKSFITLTPCVGDGSQGCDEVDATSSTVCAATLAVTLSEVPLSQNLKKIAFCTSRLE